MHAKKISLGILTSMLFALLAIGTSAHAQTTGSVINGTNSTYQTVSPSPSTSVNASTNNTTNTNTGTMNTTGTYDTTGSTGYTNTSGTVGLPNTGVGGNMALTLTEIAVGLAVLAFGGVYLRKNLVS